MLVRVGTAKFGLALGSGGLRGAAHIGVLQCLERHGLRPYCLSGSSAGAVVAALYAAGYTVEELVDLAMDLDGHQIYDTNIGCKSIAALTINLLNRKRPVGCFSPLPLPLGLVKGTAWENYLSSLLGQQSFAELQLPLALLATDVERGDAVAFAKATLAGADVTLTNPTVVQGIRASTAIPGVFQPLKLAGRTLIDGAIKASVPAHLARDLGATIVVGIDLGYAGQRHNEVDSIFEIISQSLNILGAELTKWQLDANADLVVRPKIYDVSLLDFDRIPEIIERGDAAMEASIPQLRALLTANDKV